MPKWRDLLKPQICIREEGRCFYCRQYVKLEDGTLDHIVAKNKGGDRTHPENLVWCCSSCNQSKGSKEVWAWYAQHYGDPRGLFDRLGRLAS